jgi:hypothetical protein
MAIGTAYLRINGKKTRAYRELFGQFFSKGGCLLRAKGTDAFATPGTPFFYVSNALPRRLLQNGGSKRPKRLEYVTFFLGFWNQRARSL